ncbi:MAG: peptide chain release factor N(5)-glutamine methyltransferase [Deltaproteobacteria bacterium]|nr:peptide chain release factor N(5)-glutamine methyltransferase [Deltaproteobacteria bacterium]
MALTTLSELLEWGVESLKGNSPSSRLDAELLLCEAAGVSKLALITSGSEPVSEEAQSRFRGFIDRRISREPVAYIRGIKEFWGLEFEVNKAVLIPRPETELIIERSINFVDACATDLKILDLGTGSGCIAVALAYELKKRGRKFSVCAVDCYEAALEVAARNAKKHDVGAYVMFQQSNWFESLEGQRFDLILANPPYVALEDQDLSPELYFEPRTALFAGARGTEDVEHLLKIVPQHLTKAGAFLCEIGANQRARIKVPQRGRVVYHKDLAGIDRVLEYR